MALLNELDYIDTAPQFIPIIYKRFDTQKVISAFSRGVKPNSKNETLTFTQYPLYLSLKYSYLTLNARYFYCYLKNLQSANSPLYTEYGGCILTNEELVEQLSKSKMLKMTLTCIKDSIKALVDAGLLESEKIYIWINNPQKERKKINPKIQVSRRLLRVITPNYYNTKKAYGTDEEKGFIALYHTVQENIFNDLPYINLTGIIFLDIIIAYSYGGNFPKGYVEGYTVEDYATTLGVSISTMRRTIKDLKDWGIIDTETVYLKTSPNKVRRVEVTDKNKKFLKITLKLNLLV